MTTPQEVLHEYTWIWSKEKLSWAIDGTVVRTVDYADAKGGTRFSQTPMRVRIGIWAGGDPDRIKGTIDWAGGETDFSKTPFTMYVKSVEIVNYTPAESYVYLDKSGSADSIEINGGVSSGETSSSTSFGTSATTDTASLTSSSIVLSTTASSSASQNEVSIPSTVTSSASRSGTSTSIFPYGCFLFALVLRTFRWYNQFFQFR